MPKGIFDKAELPLKDRKHVDEGDPHLTARKFVHAYLRPFKPILRTLVRYQPAPSYDRPNHPDWLLMKAILTRWISETDGHPVLIAPIPYYQYVERTASPKNYQRRFLELAELDRVALHNPLPRFWAESLEDRRKCRFSDAHLTLYGHAVLADALTPAMESFLGGNQN